MTSPDPLEREAGRSVPEWIGATPDTPVPKRVRIRVFQRYGGRCYLTKKLIRPGDNWEIEHVKPLHLARPGEVLNRESNLAPALKAPHAKKSAEERTAKSKTDRLTSKHFGMAEKPRGRSLTHPTLKRGFDGVVRPREPRP